MKRRLAVLTALILSAAMLAGCAAPVVLSRGTIKDKVYTNETAGLTFTAPDGWEYAGEDEIAQMAGTGEPETSGEASEELIVYDMIATETAAGANVMVLFQNFTISGLDIDEEAYFDGVRKTMRVSSPYDVEFSHYTDTEIGGASYKTMTVTFTANGTKQYQYIRRAGGYMICIMVSIPAGGDVDPVMACFS